MVDKDTASYDYLTSLDNNKLGKLVKAYLTGMIYDTDFEEPNDKVGIRKMLSDMVTYDKANRDM